MEGLPKKKKFGQHFLHDKNIAKKIADSLSLIHTHYQTLIEIGPGDGSLTQYLNSIDKLNLFLVEIDEDLIENLNLKFTNLVGNILNVDFLKLNFQEVSENQIGIIGNFPYNISSQIIFKIIDNRHQVPEMVGMFQKEVAERLIAPPGSKVYGGISAMVQAFYETKMLFKVGKQVFSPPPNVESAVIQLVRRDNFNLECNEKVFFQIVKASFNQRRKTLRNSLKVLNYDLSDVDPDILSNRPEQLSYLDFIEMVKIIKF